MPPPQLAQETPPLAAAPSLPRALCCPAPGLWRRLRVGRRRVLALFLATFYTGVLTIAGSSAGLAALLALRHPRPPVAANGGGDQQSQEPLQLYPLALLGGVVAGLGLLTAAYALACDLRGRRLGAFQWRLRRKRGRRRQRVASVTSGSSEATAQPTAPPPAVYWVAARVGDGRSQASPQSPPPVLTLPEPVA